MKISKKIATEVTLKLSSSMICSSNDETSVQHKLLLTGRHFSNLCIVLANNSSININKLQTWLSKMIQSWGFISRLLEPLLKTGLPLMKMHLK